MSVSHTAQVVIPNVKGLHARAAAKFVETARRFDAVIAVSRESLTVRGDSIMEVLMLAAAKGSVIEIAAEGPEAEPALAALTALVEAGFGEP